MRNIEIFRDFCRKNRIKNIRFIADETGRNGYFETITYDNFYYQSPTEFAPFQINMDDIYHFETYVPEDPKENWKIGIFFNHHQNMSIDSWLAYKFSIFEDYE